MDFTKLPKVQPDDQGPIRVAKIVNLKPVVVDPDGVELADALPPRPVADSPRKTEPEERFEMVLKGDVWRLAYGTDSTLISSSEAEGLYFIRELIRVQGRHLHVVELFASVHGNDAARAAGVGEAIVDEETKKKWRERYELCATELAQAERDHDEARSMEVKKDFNAFGQEIYTVYGLGGKSRRMGDEIDKLRKRVSMSIRRAKQKLKKHIPAFYSHLQCSLETGSFLIYKPEKQINWIA